MADITVTKRRRVKKYGAITNVYTSGGTGGSITETDPVFTAWDKDYNDLINTPTIITDHGSLTGLGDDDHTQYHNNTRGDARYYTKTNLQTSGQASVHWGNITNAPTIITDHGSLSGLGDDDHTQYHNDTRADTWLATKGIDALSDVEITSPATNSYLKYDGTKWVDEAPVSISPTATELNYVSGVTSAIQTQLNGKEPSLGNPSTDGYVLSSTTSGVRSWVAPSGGGATSLDGLSDVEITTPATNATLKYDGTKWVDEASISLTATETELNYVAGVTSAIQTQLNSKIDGTGTANYVPKMSDSNTITNSQIIDDGTNVGVGKSPSYKLDVNGDINMPASNYFRLNTNPAIQQSGGEMKFGWLASVYHYFKTSTSSPYLSLVKSNSVVFGIDTNSNTDVYSHKIVNLATPTSDTDATNKSYVDTADAAKANKNATISTKTSAYTIQSSDNNAIIECNGTFTVTLPDSMDTGFQVTIVNVGTGTITLAASTTLYTKSSNTKLASQWVGATAYHRGSNVWVAMGDLTA